jgi:hypothetical protein
MRPSSSELPQQRLAVSARHLELARAVHGRMRAGARAAARRGRVAPTLSEEIDRFSGDVRVALRRGALSPSARLALAALITTMADLLRE